MWFKEAVTMAKKHTPAPWKISKPEDHSRRAEVFGAIATLVEDLKADRLPCDAKRQQEILESISPGRVTYPAGAGEVLERHQQEAKLVHRAGRPGLEKVAPYLLRRLSDERILHLAWQQLEG